MSFVYKCGTEGCDGSYTSPVELVDVWCGKCATHTRKEGNVKRAMEFLGERVEEARVCPDCEKEKPAEDFYKGQKRCKLCFRARYGK